MKIKFVSFIVLVFTILTSFNSSAIVFKTDSLYIKPFPKKFSARILFGVKELSISIRNSSLLANSTPKVLYKPNNGIIGGFGVSYKNIVLSYHFNVATSEISNRKFGKTSIADYQLNLTTRFLIISGFHRTYQGFYVSDPSESYPSWEKGMPYPQRPDIKYVSKGIETIVSLNPTRYSLNASIKLTEQQLRSVISPLFYANYSWTSLSADSSLIPSHLQGSFFDGKELNQSKFSGWTLMPGISYGLVKSSWFINPMLFAGFGYLHKELLFTSRETYRYKDYYFKVSSRVNCGYNSKKYFAGVFVELNEMFLSEKEPDDKN